MSIWAIIPIKAPHECKTRLRPLFSDEDRQALAARMLASVVKAATGADGVDRSFILGPSRHGLDGDIALLEDAGGGLNAALGAALADAPDSVTRVLIVAADLPNLAAGDVTALAHAASNSVLIAPDRSGHGTNALSLPLPHARNFHFQFGERSFTKHENEAARLGLAFASLNSPTLALDIDTADDAAAAGLLPR